jgi:GAF domain-containing protein
MNYENTRRGDNAAPPRVLSRSELQKQVTELAAQRAAISEVLRAIASSPHDLQPIFETILDSTTRLCRAELGVFRLVEKSGLRLVANNLSPAVLERYSPPMLLEYSSFVGRLTASKSPVHIPDLAAHEVYRAGDAAAVALVKSGIRTSLLVPMLKNDELIGLLAIGRQRLERFTEKEIELVTDFAAQAAIALRYLLGRSD